MKRRKKDTFPRLAELIDETADHADNEEWSLREAIDYLHVELTRIDVDAADSLQVLLDVTDTNAMEDRSRCCDDSHCFEWEGRSNG